MKVVLFGLALILAGCDDPNHYAMYLSPVTALIMANKPAAPPPGPPSPAWSGADTMHPPKPFGTQPTTEKEIEKVCSEKSSSQCSAFMIVAAQCETLAAQAYSYLGTYRFWRSKGLSKTEAMTFASNNPTDELAIELATQAPDDETSDEFRRIVLTHCLRHAE